MDQNYDAEAQNSVADGDSQSMQASPKKEQDTVDWDSIRIEPLEHPCEIPKENSIVVVDTPVETDWTSHFTTDIAFDSPQALKTWLMEKAREVHMAIVVARSDFTPGRTPRITYQCERSGAYDNKKRLRMKLHTNLDDGKKTGTTSGGLKKTGTRKCGCPFKIKATNQSIGGNHWVIEAINGIHNHALSPSIQGHAYHARLTPQEKEMFIDLSKGGVKPKAALSILREKNPKSCTSLQTLYNVKKRIIKEEMDDRTSLQQMMMLAAERDYIVHDRRDGETNVVMNLFFAHPDSIALAKCFPYIYIMDSTYKTNVHKWPLFEIVGVTSTMKTFSVAYCFMEHETTDSFTWALQRFRELLDEDRLPVTIVTDKELALMKALEVVFPEATHLLCRWHISMGVEKRGKSLLPKDGEDPEDALKKKWNLMWSTVVCSKTVEEYERNIHFLEHEWLAWPGLYSYVVDEWVPYKEKFVGAWTDKIFHLGNTQTNRVESAHSMLKDWLRKSSRNTYLGTFEMIHREIDIQMNEIKKSFTLSINSHAHEHRNALFKHLKGCTSSACLWLLKEEFDRMVKGHNDPETCGCVAVSIYGIPCACRIGEFHRESRALSLSDIHPFWRKLSVQPRKVECDDLELHEEYALLVKKWRASPDHVKKDMLRRLREIVLPQTTWLATPNSVEDKECPLKKKSRNEWTAQQSPSSFEIDEPTIPTPSPGQHYPQYLTCIKVDTDENDLSI